MSKWDGIEEFVAVATTGAFGAGAKLLKLSPTHMSRAIIALEQRVQAQLFHRTTRTVRLTDTGRVFLEHCQRMIHERDEAIAMVNEVGEPQGDLRVTCSVAIGEHFVAPILWRHAMQHPRLNITIELSNHLVDLVAEGFDLAIRTGNLADSRLIGTRVASRALYTCAAPSYLAQAGRPTTLADLNHHECLTATSSTWHFMVGGKPQIYRPKGRFRCNGGHAIINACLAGMGICQLPEFYALPFLRSGAIELVLDHYRPADEPIWAVYPQRRHLLPKVLSVVECLRQELDAALNSSRYLTDALPDAVRKPSV